MRSVLVQLQGIGFLKHLILQDLKIDQLEDPGDLRSLILDIEEFCVAIDRSFLAERKLTDAGGEIPYTDRIRVPGIHPLQGCQHLLVQPAALPEPVQDGPEGADTDLHVRIVQETAHEAEEELVLRLA